MDVTDFRGGHRWTGPHKEEDECEGCQEILPARQLWRCWRDFWYSSHHSLCEACPGRVRKTNPFPLYADCIPSEILNRK